ncbi:MAG: TonB family protein [Candidatus Omnitrophica bacterium]|nr:TonB family protein [Candidatus Omnitrophota bacterium]
MKKIIFIALLLSVGIVMRPDSFYAGTLEEIKLYMGEPKTIAVNFPTRVAIGNPDIADITDVTKMQLTITPKAPGKTTLVYWDTFGEQSYQIRVYSEDVLEVKRRVDNLLGKLELPGVYTEVNEEEGKVFLMGRVKSPQDLERINIILGPLKASLVDLVLVKEEEAVVDIDVQVLELDKGADKSLGFTLPTSPITLTESTRKYTLATSPDAWFRISNWTRSAFTSSLNYLIKEGKARILSRPRVSCQSGKEAKLLVGGEKPTFTNTIGSSGVTTTEIDYKEYGIILNIKPVVEEDDRVRINLGVEVSEIGDVITFGTSGQAYPLTKRNVATELYMKDGQTLAVGGLLKRKTEETTAKIPFLGDIPILGLMFRQKTKTTGGGQSTQADTELFITLTPTILRGPELAKRPPETKAAAIDMQDAGLIQASFDVSDPVLAYARDVQKRILLDLTYPEEAKDAGFQGALTLSLHIASSGELLDAAVKESSGYKVLDDWAIAVAKRVGSYPIFPPTISESDIWIDVPIRYKLD